jgi:hypothetical protein
MASASRSARTIDEIREVLKKATEKARRGQQRINGSALPTPGAEIAAR